MTWEAADDSRIVPARFSSCTCICCQTVHRLRERGESCGIEAGDGAGQFGVIFGAVREEERVHAIEIGEERGRVTRGFGRGESFAVGLRVVPCAAKFGIGVERRAQGFGFGVLRGVSIFPLVRR